MLEFVQNIWQISRKTTIHKGQQFNKNQCEKTLVLDKFHAYQCGTNQGREST